MDKFVIQGGKPLSGEVRISGSKNAVLPILAATLLSDKPSVITNVPRLRDVTTMLRVLEKLGGKTEMTGPDSVRVETQTVACTEAPYDLVKTMRASFIVLGPLLARFGKARVSMPGGCAIGGRQVDLHLKGLEALGASIEIDGGYVNASAKGLRGSTIYLDFPSVGATENILLAATLADGITVIENTAMEPEITDLASCLTSMGAKIRGAGTKVIEVTGVGALHGARHEVIPDRIETGTFAIAAAITGGRLQLTHTASAQIESITAKLTETGVGVKIDGPTIEVTGCQRPRPTNVTTQPYPGFPTDLQAPFMAYLTVADGASLVSETIFENRFLHVAELRRMGANAKVQSPSGTLVTGVKSLSGAEVMASDLRAGAALVVAGLAARGCTEISRVYHIDRGYDRIEEKLAGVGASIERVR